jgi:hypothetical protein
MTSTSCSDISFKKIYEVDNSIRVREKNTFNPDDLAWVTAPARSESVVSSTLSPSSSSYCVEQQSHYLIAIAAWV